MRERERERRDARRTPGGGNRLSRDRGAVDSPIGAERDKSATHTCRHLPVVARVPDASREHVLPRLSRHVFFPTRNFLCAWVLVRRVSSAILAVSLSLSLYTALPSCSSFNVAFNVRAHILSYTAYTSRFFARAKGGIRAGGGVSLGNTAQGRRCDGREGDSRGAPRRANERERERKRERARGTGTEEPRSY